MSTASTPIRPVPDPDAVLRLADLPLSLDEIAFVLKTDRFSVLTAIETRQHAGYEVRRPAITTDSRLFCLASLHGGRVLTMDEKHRVAELLRMSIKDVIFNLSRLNAELLEKENLVEVITIDENPKTLTGEQIRNMKLVVSEIPMSSALTVALRFDAISQLWEVCRLKSGNVFSFLKAGLAMYQFPTEDTDVFVVKTELHSLLFNHGLAFDMEFDETLFTDSGL